MFSIEAISLLLTYEPLVTHQTKTPSFDNDIFSKYQLRLFATSTTTELYSTASLTASGCHYRTKPSRQETQQEVF